MAKLHFMEISDHHIPAAEQDYLYKSISHLPHAGRGLFTAIDIFKKEVIALFTGEILSNDQAKIRAQASQDQYFIAMLDGSIMDCANENCMAKYANDAKGTPQAQYKNNAKISLDEHENVCITATQNIAAGQEILVGYGKRYWQRHGK